MDKYAGMKTAKEYGRRTQEEIFEEARKLESGKPSRRSKNEPSPAKDAGGANKWEKMGAPNDRKVKC